MNETVSGLGGIVQERIVNPYSSFINALPESYQLIFNIFIYVILIALYGIFVYEFYRFLARKNIIKINLSRYNTSTHPFLKKFFAALFFLIEYVIILPVLVFFWFVVLAFMLLLLSESQPVNQILLVSAAIVGAVRVVSYFKENLARDMAKLFPLTVLGIFLLSPDFLRFSSVLEKLVEVPLFFTHIFFYLVFVIFFEIFIRAVYTLTFLFKRPEEQEMEEVEEAIKDEED
jgi:hypothetical protein